MNTCIAADVVAAPVGAPELQWELQKMNAPEGPYPELYAESEWFGPVAVALVREGRMLWRRVLSPRMKNAFRVRAEDVGRAGIWPPLPPIVIAREVVIVLDGSGVLVLRRSDGGVLLDK
ncbi:MAG: hypothetical protein ACJ790_01365 [Myxococcaceae bacterium]